MNHKTCALCGKYTTLRDSHFIPKFVYKVLNNTKKADTNITIKNESGKLIPLSKQITSHRLCGECEARFSENGERFFSQNAFPQREVLDKINMGTELLYDDAPPLLKDIASKYQGKNSFYSLNQEGEKKLLYFVISILWRGALTWPMYQSIKFPEHILNEMKDFLLNDIPLKHLKVFVDLTPHGVFSILKPHIHPDFPSCYRFNLLYYMFHIVIVNDNKGTPLSYGKAGMLVKKCINDMRSMYNHSEKSPKVPHKLSWL
ncbi:hypothetical protein A6046_00845 [[Haemophilus] ducreyi]|uniref:hypothetical protein n=1 Tax=Haemophilus ducreyi TaxID=730 RepID=UPI0007CDDEF1|nr:hypothetical protein [[Haemophilus] ducreyi]ANF70945.1 hypothetical protein A6043_06325 [[Haemophilus] ducreyi]ANF71873.1 hypothetical protein A6044_02790 [[Haemophilus] ducreyi]ANF74231.1 hypothetical protein A6045_07495 [[Haemophilus] ducreyi]ANF74666.1 hypothetical protein A6046_00845 [[Haemophilus] ducreyi]